MNHIFRIGAESMPTTPIPPDQCIYKLNTFSFKLILMIGAVIVCTNFTASKALKKIGKFAVIRKIDSIFYSNSVLILFYNLVPWLCASAAVAIVLMFTSYFYLNVLLMGFLITSSASAIMTLSIAADLFPTQYK